MTKMTKVVDVYVSLAERWEADALAADRRHDARGAALLRDLAAELRAAHASAGAEALTLGEAAKESGYSTEHLRHLVSSGALPNSGRRHSPRIARADLPKKPTRQVACGYDPAADALSIISKGA